MICNHVSMKHPSVSSINLIGAMDAFIHIIAIFKTCIPQLWHYPVKSCNCNVPKSWMFMEYVNDHLLGVDTNTRTKFALEWSKMYFFEHYTTEVLHNIGIHPWTSLHAAGENCILFKDDRKSFPIHFDHTQGFIWSKRNINGHQTIDTSAPGTLQNKLTSPGAPQTCARYMRSTSLLV